jgi:hypothetical protein
MDNQTKLPKRKRADTVLNNDAIKGLYDPELTIIVNTSQHRKPSIEEDNPEDSDVEQPDNKPLEQSTLFWSTQLVISRQNDDLIGLGKPSAEHKMQTTPYLQYKVHIIKLYLFKN